MISAARRGGDTLAEPQYIICKYLQKTRKRDKIYKYLQVNRFDQISFEGNV